MMISRFLKHAVNGKLVRFLSADKKLIHTTAVVLYPDVLTEKKKVGMKSVMIAYSWC